MTLRSLPPAALAAIVMAMTFTTAALAIGSSARPPTKSERSAIMASFTANDGGPSEVHGVYVSRSNASLAVVCIHTPEAGTQAFVLRHTQHSWRYVTSGAVGSTGTPTDRRLERACG